MALPADLAWLSTNEWFHAALVLALFTGIGWIFQNILIVGLKRLTAKTTSDIDDILLHVAARPLFFLIMLIGAYIAARTISTLDAYGSLLNGLFYIFAAALAAWMGARILAFLITRWFTARRGLSGSPRLLNIIVGVIIWLAAGIIVLAHFNVEITPFIATLGVGGLAVGLALQGTLSNIFAGMHIISDQPVRVGDFIEIEDGKVTGHVEDIGWRSTRIRTLQDNIVIVPNARLADSVIQNVSMPSGHVRVNVGCGVGYGSDLTHVEKVLMDTGKHVQNTCTAAVHDAEPVVRFTVFGESNIDFTISMLAKAPAERKLLVHETIKAIHARFEKEGIEISWPVRRIVTDEHHMKKKH